MTRPSKRKINVKEQERDNNGRFAKKIQTVDNWGDDDDSGWDYDNGWDNDVNWSDNLLNERKKVELVWSNNAYLERKERGPYLTGKTKKSVILEAGHKCIFYPKFHCGLNYIERYWGAAKRYAATILGQACNVSFLQPWNPLIRLQ